jgi:hypothetical protein
MSDRIILEGVDHYRVTEAMFEGVRVIMTYRGEPCSPAYAQGISGAAFRIAGICPCAPTCSAAMEPAALARLFGYEVESMPLDGEGDEREARLAELLARVKGEVRAGRPALLWHAFTSAEWDVVCGFDDESHEFYGRGSYMGRDAYARAGEARTLTCLDICPALGAVFIGAKTGGFDARAAELAALREAVRHARAMQQPDGKGWMFCEGLQCYDRWVNEFAADASRKRGAGDAYCLGVYRSTHRAAGDFMRELALRYPEATSHFDRAAACFTAEADALDRCAPDLGWDSPEGPDAQRNARAGRLLGVARDQYALGIAAIEQALSVITNA